MLVEKFNYKEYQTVEKDNKRFYDIDGTLLPSVTTILSSTKTAASEEALAKWRIRVGDVEAKNILEKSLKIGSLMHKNLEEYAIDNKSVPKGNVQEKLMTSVMIKKGMVNVNEVWGCEVPLFYKNVYAGRTDMIGVYKGKPSIIDFKNSIKPKKLEWIDDYLTQISAYAEAHNSMFGTNIEQFVILLVTQEFEFQEFLVEPNKIQKYTDMWHKRVEEFYDKAQN